MIIGVFDSGQGEKIVAKQLQELPPEAAIRQLTGPNATVLEPTDAIKARIVEITRPADLPRR